MSTPYAMPRAHNDVIFQNDVIMHSCQACICQHTSRTTQTLASLDPRSFPKSFAVRRVWGPDYLLALSVYSVSNSVCLLILDDVLVVFATVQTHIFSLWSSCVRRPEYLRPNAFTACTYNCCWHRCISSIAFLHPSSTRCQIPE